MCICCHFAILWWDFVMPYVDQMYNCWEVYILVRCRDTTNLMNPITNSYKYEQWLILFLDYYSIHHFCWTLLLSNHKLSGWIWWYDVSVTVFLFVWASFHGCQFTHASMKIILCARSSWQGKPGAFLPKLRWLRGFCKFNSAYCWPSQCRILEFGMQVLVWCHDCPLSLLQEYGRCSLS
jgi:hypothetical protein